MNSIFVRRSIRKYLAKPVEEEKLDQLLRAAMQAPSAGNQRPWEFIVVQDKEMLNKLSLMSPYAGPAREAPAAIVVLGNRQNLKFPEIWQQDLAAATQNLLLQAVELELGAVWLGVAPVEERMTYITELFALPDVLLPFAVIPLGYPATPNQYADRYEKTRIHYETY